MSIIGAYQFNRKFNISFNTLLKKTRDEVVGGKKIK